MSPRRRRAGEVLCTMFLISETSRATGMPQVSAPESLVSGAARLTAVRRERQQASELATIMTVCRSELGLCYWSVAGFI